MIAEIKPIAELVGHNAAYAKGAAVRARPRKLPLGRVINDKKVTDHHAIIPTKGEHNISKFGDDEKKIYDLVAKRFLAIFHPGRGLRAHAGRDRGHRSTSSAPAAAA